MKNNDCRSLIQSWKNPTLINIIKINLERATVDGLPACSRACRITSLNNEFWHHTMKDCAIIVTCRTKAMFMKNSAGIWLKNWNHSKYHSFYICKFYQWCHLPSIQSWVKFLHALGASLDQSSISISPAVVFSNTYEIYQFNSIALLWLYKTKRFLCFKKFDSFRERAKILKINQINPMVSYLINEFLRWIINMFKTLLEYLLCTICLLTDILQWNLVSRISRWTLTGLKQLRFI